MSDDLAAAISGAANPGAVLRTGILTGIAGTTLSVDVGGGTVLDMPRMESYIPILGDAVMVLQQGALNLVLGAPAGMPADNAIYNPSFELDVPGAAPSGWTIFLDPGGTQDPAVTVQPGVDQGAKDGMQMLQIAHGPTAGYCGVYVVSQPIAVTPGERWSAAAYVLTGAQAGDDQPTVHLRLAWFASTAGVYSEDILSEAELQSFLGPTGPRWTPVRVGSGTGSVAPDGAGALRIVLWTEVWGGYVFWDKVIARKFGTAM